MLSVERFAIHESFTNKMEGSQAETSMKAFNDGDSPLPQPRLVTAAQRPASRRRFGEAMTARQVNCQSALIKLMHCYNNLVTKTI